MSCAKKEVFGKESIDACNGSLRNLTDIECMQYGAKKGSTMCQRHKSRVHAAVVKLGCCCPATKWEHNAHNQNLVPCPERLLILFHQMKPKTKMSGRICYMCRDNVDKDPEYTQHRAYSAPRKRVSGDWCVVGLWLQPF